MNKLIISLFLLCSLQATNVKGQIHLSPVNTGDCVCARIQTERTSFADAVNTKYCVEHNKDKEKQRKCIENSRSNSLFIFFTDRGTESDYYIGINGKEITLKRISKQPGKPIDFIGTFTGEGINVNIGHARLVSEEYEPKSEGGRFLSAEYKVDVTVMMGKVTNKFKVVYLSYGL